MALPKADLEVIFIVDGSRLGRQTTNTFDKFGRIVRGFSTRMRRAKSFKVMRDRTQESLRQLSKEMQAEIGNFEDVTKLAVQKAVNRIKAESKALTPIDTGDLRRSAFAVTDKVRGMVTGKVGYNITSGPVPPGVVTGVDYAILVHENDTFFHKPPTQSAFLLTAAQSLQGEIKAIFEHDVKRKLRR